MERPSAPQRHPGRLDGTRQRLGPRGQDGSLQPPPCTLPPSGASPDALTNQRTEVTTATFLYVPVCNSPLKAEGMRLLTAALGQGHKDQARGLLRCLLPGDVASGVWEIQLYFSHIDTNKALSLLGPLLRKTHQGQRKNMTWRLFPAASGPRCLAEVTPAGKTLLPLTSVSWPRTASTRRALRLARGLFAKWSMTHAHELLFVLLYTANVAFNGKVFAKRFWTHPNRDPRDQTAK